MLVYCRILVTAADPLVCPHAGVLPRAGDRPPTRWCARMLVYCRVLVAARPTRWVYCRVLVYCRVTGDRPPTRWCARMLVQYRVLLPHVLVTAPPTRWCARMLVYCRALCIACVPGRCSRRLGGLLFRIQVNGDDRRRLSVMLHPSRPQSAYTVAVNEPHP